MTKFYGEMRGNAFKHQIGHKYVDVNLYYGSREDSKLGVNVRINHPEGKPITIWVDGKVYKEIIEES